MVRELTNHKVNGLNNALLITAVGQPNAGNACCEYSIVHWQKDLEDIPLCDIKFQNGPIDQVGVTGISNEALLAIVEDRLIGFQSGPFACRENAVALTKLQECVMWLQKRTRDRDSRGVEGTHLK
jgi:hypothetical protein